MALLVSGTCSTTAQFKRRAGVGPAHYRRRARRAGTDSEGTTRSGIRGPGNAKTPAARSVAGVGSEGRWFSQRRRCLHPPCRSPGRRSYVCCAFSPCADSLVSLQPSVGRNLITVFSAVNSPREKFSGRRPAHSRRRTRPDLVPDASMFVVALRASRNVDDESAENKRVLKIACACMRSRAHRRSVPSARQQRFANARMWSSPALDGARVSRVAQSRLRPKCAKFSAARRKSRTPARCRDGLDREVRKPGRRIRVTAIRRCGERARTMVRRSARMRLRHPRPVADASRPPTANQCPSSSSRSA